MLVTAVAGLLFGLSLIVAIGPQNVFVLQVGARRHGVGAVVAVCSVADVVLIAAGVAGLGAAVQRSADVLTVLRILGVLFLLGYAALAARRALRPAAVGTADPPAGRVPALVATALALTLLNPGVYLDTVVLLGSVAVAHGDLRWWFALGAALASVLWFAVIGFGARRLAHRLRQPRTWRLLDGFVAAVMVVTAVRLIVG